MSATPPVPVAALLEAIWQCKFALGGQAFINQALRELRTPEWQKYPLADIDLMCGTDYLLTGASRLSRLLWPELSSADPISRAACDRAEQLRATLQLPAHSPVLSSPEVSGYLLRYTEQLGAWEARSLPPEPPHLAMRLCPADDMELAGLQTSAARLFDPETRTCMIFGVRYDLRAIVMAVSDLHYSAGQALEGIYPGSSETSM